MVEDGFRSVLALVNHTTPYIARSRAWPTSDTAQYIIEDLGGLSYQTIIENESLMFKEGYVEVTTAIEAARKPVLLICTRGFASTLAALLYDINSSNITDNKQKLFYRRVAGLGYDHAKKSSVRKFVAETLEEKMLNDPEVPTIIPEDWYSYLWELRPVFKNNFLAGQIQSNYIESLVALKVAAVVNTRKTTTNEGAPSQEETTLLNIRDKTGTYTGTGRQSQTNLEGALIDPGRNLEWSAEESKNYESMNPLEWGDSIGYNETSEAQQLSEEGFNYENTPIGKILT